MRRVTKYSMNCLFCSLLAGALSSASAQAGPMLYASDESGALAAVNASTGKVSMIGSMGVVMTDIAANLDGNLFGISYDGLYRIDRHTAAVTWIGQHHIPGANALTFSPEGELFAAGSGSTKLFSIDTSNGVATIHKEIGYASAGDLAYANIGCPPNYYCITGDLPSLYMSSTDGDLIKIGEDRAGGLAIGVLGVNDMFGMAKGPNGELYGFAGNTLYAIDIWNGAARIVSSLAGQGLGPIYGATASIPEPASGALAIFAGVARLAFFTRRRRRTSVN